MLNLKKINSIKCPKCEKTPLIKVNIENNTILIEYKCHQNKFEEISPDKFINFLSVKCELCQRCLPNLDYTCYCGNFCEDDYLYHLLISKHQNIKVDEEKNEFNNEEKNEFNNEPFKFFCFSCNTIFHENFNIEEHNNHYFIDYNTLINLYNNYSNFISNNINQKKI